MAADWLLLFEAYARIGVSLSVLINYTGPALVLALSPAVFRERITFAKVAALAAALLGAFFISGQAAGEGINAGGLPDPRRRCVWGMLSEPEAVMSGQIFAGTFLRAAS